jgi:Ran GTPase-activating protein (RanGAP) involved in mRNA processing and transport
MANTHISITTAVPHHQSATSENPASPNHAAPSFDTYRNNPVSYAQAAEQYFAGNAARLHKHLTKQLPEAQTALIDHSELLRDYLGIGHPRALRKRLPQSAPVPRIPYSEAPAALALASTRVSSDSRVDRSLNALADILEKNPVGREPDTRDGREYKKSVETALVYLLNDFQKLPCDAAQRKAINIICMQFNQLDPAAKEKIRLAVQQPLSDPVISDGLKNDLRVFDIRPSLRSLPTEIYLNIFDKLQELGAEDARKDCPDIVPDQARRAAARTMANVRLVSHSFRNIADDHPVTGTETTRNAISGFSKLDKKTFRQKMVDLCSQHRHIGIDFSVLSDDKKQIVLDVLSQNTQNHLRNVQLCGTKPTQEVANALLRMNQNNPVLKIGLDLSSQSVNHQDAITLAGALRQSQVTGLDLSNSQGIGAEGITAIAGALVQSKVTDLNLSGTAMNHQAAAAIAGVLAQSAVTVLKLHNNHGIGSEGATAIAGALAQSKVTTLDMSDTDMDHQGAVAIAGVLPQSKVTFLDLSNNRRVGLQGAIAIAGALAQSKVTDLNLGGTGITPQAATAIAGALAQSDVAALDLSNNDIGVQGATAIAGALPQSNVTTLNLRRSRIGPQGVAAIAGALAQSKVTTLNLSGCQIDQQAAMAIATALQQSNVTSLDLSGCQLDHQAAAIIAGALAQSKVTHLDLSNNRVGLEGAMAIAGVLPQSKVTNLNLNKCQIGSQGAAALASALPQSKVTHLNLDDNQIGPEGARAIAGVLPHSKVTYVGLKENALGDEAATALVGVLPPQSKLDLSNNNLGSDTAIAIAKMLSQSNVNHLDLSGNRIGRRGAMAIAGALPQSRVAYLNLSFNDARNRGNRIGDSIAVALARTLQKTRLTYLDLRNSFVGYRGGMSLISKVAQSKISTLGLSTNNGLDTRVRTAGANVAATHPFTLM